VKEEKEAVAWLEAALIDAAHDAPAPLLAAAGAEPADVVARAAKTVYAWARGYAEVLRAEGKALPREGQEALMDLYRALKSKKVRDAG
jgi:hypothetical protein